MEALWSIIGQGTPSSTLVFVKKVCMPQPKSNSLPNIGAPSQFSQSQDLSPEVCHNNSLTLSCEIFVTKNNPENTNGSVEFNVFQVNTNESPKKSPVEFHKNNLTTNFCNGFMMNHPVRRISQGNIVR